MSTFIQNLIGGLSFGSTTALFALGVVLIFGIMNLVNFAHGSVIMVAAYAIVQLPGVPLALRIVLAILAAVALALVIDRLAFRPIRGADGATLLITSFAVAYVLQNVALMIWGAFPKSAQIFPGLLTSFSVGSVTIPKLDVVTLAVTLVLLAATAALLGRTSIGAQMRAAAEDFRTARSLGVRANWVIAAAFALSGALAAVGAILYTAQVGSVATGTGGQVVLTAFVAAVLGGMGSLWGAVIGAYTLGIVTVLMQGYLPAGLTSYRDVFTYLVVFMILTVRPSGLAGGRAAQGRI